MFPEASTIEIRLSRETASGTVPIVHGEWHASGHRFVWTDRVKDPVLRRLDVTVDAAYGARTQVERLQAALGDVAAHIEADQETRALVATVIVSTNGREPQEITLRAAR